MWEDISSVETPSGIWGLLWEIGSLATTGSTTSTDFCSTRRNFISRDPKVRSTAQLHGKQRDSKNPTFPF